MLDYLGVALRLSMRHLCTDCEVEWHLSQLGFYCSDRTPWPKSSWGGNGLFNLIACSPSSWEFKGRDWRRGHEETLLAGLLILSYRPGDDLHRNSTTHTTHSGQGLSHQSLIQAVPFRLARVSLFSVKDIPSSQIFLGLCQVGKVNQHWMLITRSVIAFQSVSFQVFTLRFSKWVDVAKQANKQKL